MKLMLSLVIIVMLKCNRLSTAPTDFQTEPLSSSNRSSEDQSPTSEVAYVTNNDEDAATAKTGVLLQLRRSIRSDNREIEARRRSAIDKNFMRFGRAGNMLRFGRSMPPPSRSEYDNEENDVEDDTQINEPYSMKMRRGNMMRFGKRNYENLENDYIDDASENYDLMEQPVRRTPDNNYSEQGSKILRLGRSSIEISGESSERPSSREKKPTDGNILRFGKRGDNLLRFGRGNMMRFGRANMMRFGRGNVMRFGKRARDSDYSRSVRAGNVLRFGKRDGSRVYCEGYNCLLQEKENQQIDSDNDDQLKTLFGTDKNDDDLKQSQLHNEYIITK